MTILHIIESTGGSADFVLYLLKYLPHQNHIVIHSNRTFGKRLEEVKNKFPNAQFFHWKYAQREINFFDDIKSFISLYKLLKEIDTDVIHVHSSKAGFVGRLVCFLLGKRKVIYTPNGLAFLRTDVPWVSTSIYILLERIAYWLNGKIISCSKSEAEAQIKSGIKSKYINNGTEIFEMTRPPKQSDETIRIVTTGRITIQKNPAMFNLIAKHFESDSNYEFVWIGGGELENLLNSRNISITGWVDRSLVTEEVAQADIYISTALWEGLPFAVLEAMNLGKPLLLNNCVGNKDLVHEGENGYIFTKLEEAIDRIYFLSRNRKKIRLMGKYSRQLVVEHFNVEQMARQYEAAYAELLNQYN